jgi:hypothetical protein
VELLIIYMENNPKLVLQKKKFCHRHITNEIRDYLGIFCQKLPKV